MAHLLIVELPGGNDTDIVVAAQARGDAFTFLSGQLDHYRRQPAVAAALAGARAQIDVAGFDDAAVEREVLAVHAERPIDALLCLVDVRIPEAARLARRLGLRHLNPDSAALLRDKFSVRERLAARGLPQPAFALATSNAGLRVAVERLGLPVLIKPSDGYGSQNVVVLQDPEDLDPLLSPLDDMLPCRADYGLGVRANDRLLVERYMTGTFVGCDTLSIDGRHRLVGVHEKLMFAPPSFAIRGSCFTPRRPEHAALERYAIALLDGVDFDWGAAHIELMLTAEGPRLVEINPRLVGAKIARLVGFALDRSQHADLIALHAGEPLTDAGDRGQVAVTRWIVAGDEGVLDRVVVPARRDPRIRCVEILKQPGDRVRPPFENADRIGCVMTCAATRAEAEAVADAYVDAVGIVLRTSAPAGAAMPAPSC